MINVFGKNHEEIGSLDKDLILKTRGQVRIQFGKKFVSLLNSKGQLDVNIPSFEAIKEVEDPNLITSNGFYYYNGVIIAYVNGNKLEFSTDSTIEEITSALVLKADKTEIPTKVSELENDSNFISDIGVESINGLKGNVLLDLNSIIYLDADSESTEDNIILNGVTLENGLTVVVKNSVIDAVAGYTITYNGVTESVYDNTLQETSFSKDSVLLFIYDENTGWICLSSASVESLSESDIDSILN